MIAVNNYKLSLGPFYFQSALQSSIGYAPQQRYEADHLYYRITDALRMSSWI